MSGLFRSVRVGWRGKGSVPTPPPQPPSTGGVLDFSDLNNSALIALLGGI